ncbi:hypothetical protein A6A06_13310 [Streptomyces sp. CB02923]|uniref:hypothetical protein n=1 Tax=Streptomyces sp. CB02923 TaxID=1718985 RepID=UPI0009400296|nr:hypothetical protein [Streptomyces sp. CB02923]OKI02068.1 hypothetical protein A6A06_13310 [Streptomyces sp. CB02923]
MPIRPQEPTVTLRRNGRPITLDTSRPLDQCALKLTEANRSALADLFASLDILENLIGQIRDNAHDTVSGAGTCLAQSLHHVQTSLAAVEALDDLTRHLLPRLVPPHESGSA